MKKFLSMLLALTLMFALAVPAFAAADTDGSDAMPHQKTINVYADLDLGDPEIGDTVYYTEITWDIESFKTDKFTPKYVWMPNGVSEQDTTPQYVYGWTAEDLKDIGWSNTEANFSLTLTNRSNAEVGTTVRYYGAGLAMDNPKDFYNQPGMGNYTGELNLHDDNRNQYCVYEDSVYELDDSEVYYFDSFYASLRNAAPETPSATNLKGAPQSLELTGTIELDGYNPRDIFPSGTTQYSVGQVTVTLYVD